ncbi:calcium ion antiporter [Aureococcus anophagefferens]|nr:calcium ion antiporter [Aureococcus anophagefferens]
MADEDEVPAWVGELGAAPSYVLLITGTLVLFWALSVVCEERFVPALSVICERCAIPDDIAGATIMAAGASSPEVFSSLVALFITHSSLGVGTVVGSEIFNHLCICAGSVLSAKGGVLILDKAIVAREASFYLLSLVLLSYFLTLESAPESDDPGGPAHIVIRWWAGFILVACYGAYVVVCATFEKIKACVGYAPPPGEDEEAAPDEYPTPRRSFRRRPSLIEDEPTANFHDEFEESHDDADEPAAGGRRPSLGKRLNSSTIELVEEMNLFGMDAKLEEMEQSPGELACHVFRANRFYRNCRASAHAWELRCAEDPDGRVVPDRKSDVAAAEPHPTDDEEPSLVEWPHGSKLSFAGACHVALFPLKLALHGTIVDVRLQTERLGEHAAAACVACVVWLAVLSLFMCSFCETLGAMLGLPDAVVGITFSAVGTSLPNLVASMVVARKGLGNMAVSNAGSNTLNVLIGLGLPWLAFCLSHGGVYHGLPAEDIVVPVLVLVVTLLLFLVLLLWGSASRAAAASAPTWPSSSGPSGIPRRGGRRGPGAGARAQATFLLAAMADSDSDDSDIVIEELPSGAPPAAAADAESSDDDIVITEVENVTKAKDSDSDSGILIQEVSNEADDDSDGILVTEVESDDDSDGILIEDVTAGRGGEESSEADDSDDDDDDDDDDDMPTIEEHDAAGAAKKGLDLEPNSVPLREEYALAKKDARRKDQVKAIKDDIHDLCAEMTPEERRWKAWWGGQGHPTCVNNTNLERYIPDCPIDVSYDAEVTQELHGPDNLPRLESDDEDDEDDLLLEEVLERLELDYLIPQFEDEGMGPRSFLTCARLPPLRPLLRHWLDESCGVDDASAFRRATALAETQARDCLEESWDDGADSLRVFPKGEGLSATYPTFSWRQRVREIELRVLLPPGCTGRDLTVKILPRRISVTVKREGLRFWPYERNAWTSIVDVGPQLPGERAASNVYGDGSESSDDDQPVAKTTGAKQSAKSFEDLPGVELSDDDELEVEEMAGDSDEADVEEMPPLDGSESDEPEVEEMPPLDGSESEPEVEELPMDDDDDDDDDLEVEELPMDSDDDDVEVEELPPDAQVKWVDMGLTLKAFEVTISNRRSAGELKDAVATVTGVPTDLMVIEYDGLVIDAQDAEFLGLVAAKKGIVTVSEASAPTRQR